METQQQTTQQREQQTETLRLWTRKGKSVFLYMEKAKAETLMNQPNPLACIIADVEAFDKLNKRTCFAWGKYIGRGHYNTIIREVFATGSDWLQGVEVVDPCALMNDPNPKKTYFARWLSAGKYNAEPLQSRDKDSLFVEIVEKAKENRGEGANAFFDVWSVTEGETFVRNELKGLIDTKGKPLFQTDEDEGHELELHSVPRLANGKVYNRGSVYFLAGEMEKGFQGAGTLCALCFGKSWGLDCGACLAPLYDEQGAAFVFPEYRGRGARLNKTTLTLEKY